MILFLLGGKSVSNQKWIEKVDKLVNRDFEKTVIQYYDHWKTGIGDIDVEKELKELEEKTRDVSDWVVFAKSAGALVVLKGIYEKKLSPKKCIFIGLALHFGRVIGDIDTWLKDYSVPTLFIEKTNDPACSYSELLEILEKSNAKNYSTKEISGDDHEYDDIEMIKDEITTFFQ